MEIYSWSLRPRHPFCASLHSRNAHGHVTRVILCGIFQGIYSCTLRPRHLFCERLGNRNAYGHFTKAILCGNSCGKLPYASTATLVLREPAPSKCTWTWKFIGKMPDAPDTTPIKHRPSTLTVRTPQCGHTVRGKKENCESRG